MKFCLTDEDVQVKASAACNVFQMLRLLCKFNDPTAIRVQGLVQQPFLICMQCVWSRGVQQRS